MPAIGDGFRGGQFELGTYRPGGWAIGPRVSAPLQGLRETGRITIEERQAPQAGYYVRSGYPTYQPVFLAEGAREQRGQSGERVPAREWLAPTERSQSWQHGASATGPGERHSAPFVSGGTFERGRGSTGQIGEPRVTRPQPLSRSTQPTPRTQVEQSVRPWTQVLRGRISEENARGAKQGAFPSEGLWPTKPGGTNATPVIMNRGGDPVIGAAFANIRRRFGDPGFGYNFSPHPTSAFSVDQGRFGGRGGRGAHFGVPGDWHHRSVYVAYYSPWYFDDPFFAGFWYPGYYPSIYYYYGWVPRWCYPPSLVVYGLDPYPFYVEQAPYYYLQVPRLDEAGVATAAADIRAAWLDSDIGRLAYYLRPDEKISVYFDGNYEYSLSRDDYYSMTLDAMSTIKTQQMDFDDPVWINSSEVFLTGRHVFENPQKATETVYVSYRLHQYGGKWYIIGAGSSPKPIKSDYKDFRYR